MAEEIEVRVEAPSEPTPDRKPVVNPDLAFASGQATVRAEVAEEKADAAEKTAEEADTRTRYLGERLDDIWRDLSEVRETAERAEVLALAAAAAWAEEEEDVEERSEDEGSADAGPDVAPLPDVPARSEDRPHWSRRQRPWVKIGGDAR